MPFFNYLLSFLLAITPSSTFDCDGYPLEVTIRNNLNGDFAIVHDLERIDQGAFVVLDWQPKHLMLPISFQAGEISFTDKKWLWSYKDNEIGLHIDTPRLSQVLPNGEILEHVCILKESNSQEK